LRLLVGLLFRFRTFNEAVLRKTEKSIDGIKLESGSLGFACESMMGSHALGGSKERVMRVFLVLLLVSVSSIFNSRSASLASCDEASLRAAVSAGGTVTFDCAGKIPLSQTLQITNDVVIDGSGHQVTISGSNAVRIFAVTSGVKLTLINLTIADGRLAGTNGTASVLDGESVAGAGIYNGNGSVTLIGCSITNNAVVAGNGQSTGNGGSAHGGAIMNDGGTVQASNCFFAANIVRGGTGGTGPAGIGSGAGGQGSGGAVYNQAGQLTLITSVMAFNSATGGLAGGSTLSAYGSSGDGSGGALHSSGGSVNVSESRFEGNNAVGNDLPWNGAVTGKGLGGAIRIVSGTLSAYRSRFNENLAIGGQRARHAAESGEGRGGAIFAESTASLIDCLFSTNRATTLPAGDAGGTGKGGAIYNSAPLDISGCAFVENSAVGGDGIGIGAGLCRHREGRAWEELFITAGLFA
jgi:hypothetical protein